MCTKLTHFGPIFHFYTPWKRQKTKDFLTFSGGIEIGLKLVNQKYLNWVNLSLLFCISDMPISQLAFTWCQQVNNGITRAMCEICAKLTRPSWKLVKRTGNKTNSLTDIRTAPCVVFIKIKGHRPWVSATYHQ